MDPRLALALPLLVVLGCGGAPPPPADAPKTAEQAIPASPDPGKDRDKELGVGAPSATAAADAAPPPAAPQRAAVVDAPLSGKLTQAEIARILEKQGALFDACYAIGAGGKASAKDFRAVVTVKATVGPTGAVNAAEVLKSTAKSSKVDTCVRDAFKKVKFPAPKDGGTTVLTFPISFNGSEMVAQ